MSGLGFKKNYFIYKFIVFKFFIFIRISFKIRAQGILNFKYKLRLVK